MTKPRRRSSLLLRRVAAPSTQLARVAVRRDATPARQTSQQPPPPRSSSRSSVSTENALRLRRTQLNLTEQPTDRDKRRPQRQPTATGKVRSPSSSPVGKRTCAAIPRSCPMLCKSRCLSTGTSRTAKIADTTARHRADARASRAPLPSLAAPTPPRSASPRSPASARQTAFVAASPGNSAASCRPVDAARSRRMIASHSACSFPLLDVFGQPYPTPRTVLIRRGDLRDRPRAWRAGGNA